MWAGHEHGCAGSNSKQFNLIHTLCVSVCVRARVFALIAHHTINCYQGRYIDPARRQLFSSACRGLPTYVHYWTLYSSGTMSHVIRTPQWYVGRNRLTFPLRCNKTALSTRFRGARKSYVIVNTFQTARLFSLSPFNYVELGVHRCRRRCAIYSLSYFNVQLNFMWYHKQGFDDRVMWYNPYICYEENANIDIRLH
jgi:hypothetical protein